MDEKIEFKPIYTTFDKGTIASIKSLLDTTNIIYYVDNEHAASLVAGEVSGFMTVMVTSNQADLAKELLKEVKG